MLNRKPKVLLWDIETSLMLASVFQLKTDYINYNNIIQDWHIISGAWKWEGEKKIHSVSVLDNKNKHMDNDKFVVQTLRDVVAEADVIVHHNGDHFDLKKLNTRIIKHRIAPLDNKLVTVDTYKHAKRTFNFTSNRLDYLGIFLGVGEKIHNEPGLWLGALKGDKKAIASMVKYNIGDIVLQEAVYSCLKPYINHIPTNQITADREACPSCGSDGLTSKGYRRTVSNTFQRFQCNKCGHYCQSKKPVDKSLTLIK